MYWYCSIKDKCPQLLDLSIESHLFKLSSSTDIRNTLEGMAKAFQVPYSGRLPMDRNMMAACEGLYLTVSDQYCLIMLVRWRVVCGEVP